MSLRERWDESVRHFIVDLTSVDRTQLNQSVLDATSLISTTWFDRVKSMYNEHHRAYHNWNHVKDVLSSLDFLLDNQQQMNVTPLDVTITTLAAFFHDSIYNPRSSTNEKDSADLFEKFVAELYSCTAVSNAMEKNTTKPGYIKSDVTSKVVECIIASATHIKSSIEANESSNTIVAIFLDADISILGKSPGAYDKYAGCIREEYRFVERNIYCAKRAEILESFLPLEDGTDASDTNTRKGMKKEHHFVFATEVGRSKWEENARCNLKREIESLKHAVIPCEYE